MVIVNKAVLNTAPFPITFLWIQLIMAVVLLWAFSFFGILKLPTVDLAVCKLLWPLIGINVIGLAFNTLCLQYVEASFFQVTMIKDYASHYDG
jgi:GDP-fucose transporter C1